MSHDCLTARTLYRTLVDRRKTLQEQKTNCELDLKQYALHPEFYSTELVSSQQKRATYGQCI